MNDTANDTMYTATDDPTSQTPRVSRRAWLGVAAVFTGMVASLWPRTERRRALRPPAALPEAAFLQRCIRCYRCAEVCPVKAIRFDVGSSLGTRDTPLIIASDRACIACMACTTACPTGALTPTSSDPQIVATTVRMGVPVLNRGKCLAWTGKGICRLCYYVCPYPERAVRLDGVRQGPLFNADACIGCGLCEEACPTSARAIHIEPVT